MLEGVRELFNYNSYILINILAIIIGYVCLLIIEKLNKNEKFYLTSFYSFCVLGYIIGTILLYLFETLLTSGDFSFGFSFAGGLLGYIIFMYIYNYWYHELPSKLNKIILFGIPIIYGIAKIGCYLNDCCEGIFTFPLQIIECICYLSISIIFILLYRNNKFNSSYISIICLSIVRIITDFFRIKRNPIICNINLSQFICVIVIGICIFLIKKERVK